MVVGLIPVDVIYAGLVIWVGYKGFSHQPMNADHLSFAFVAQNKTQVTIMVGGWINKSFSIDRPP